MGNPHDVDIMDEVQVKAVITGTWSHFQVFPDTSAQEMRIAILSDGTFQAHIGFTLPDNSIGDYRYSGSWRYSKGSINCRVNVSTAPDIVPVGFTTVDKILRLTQLELVLIDGITDRSQVFDRE